MFETPSCRAISRRLRVVLFRTASRLCGVITFKISDLREISQNFILHTIGEIDRYPDHALRFSNGSTAMLFSGAVVRNAFGIRTVERRRV